MGDRFTLEESWASQAGGTYKIEFEQGDMEDDHYIFLFSCAKPSGDVFVFRAQISPKLVEKLGIDPAADAKKLMKMAAGQGMADLKIRLNAGHDQNFEGLPYIKAYTLRDKPGFERFL
jgi:hypothetical protein